MKWYDWKCLVYEKKTKQIGSEKILGQKTCWVQKELGPKKSGYKIIVEPEKVLVLKNLGTKKLTVKNNLGSKIIWDPKQFWGLENFCVKKFCVKKVLCSKNFRVNFFGSNKFGVQKKLWFKRTSWESTLDDTSWARLTFQLRVSSQMLKLELGHRI